MIDITECMNCVHNPNISKKMQRKIREDTIDEVIKVTWEFAEEINTFETYKNEVLKELEKENDSI